MQNLLYINKGDIYPPYAFQALEADGVTPIDVTSCTAIFTMKDAVTGTVVVSNGAASVSSTSYLTYQWSASDVATPGLYRTWFTVSSFGTYGSFLVPREPETYAYVVVLDNITKGSYIVAEEVFARYPVMRTYGLAPQFVDTDLIPHAEAELNGRLGVAFPVPITNGSSMYLIKDLAIEMTYCKALFTKEPKQASERYELLVKKLDDIVAGKIAIPGVGSGSTAAAGVEVWSTTKDYNSVHGMLDAQDSNIDPYQKLDEYSKRRYGYTDDDI